MVTRPSEIFPAPSEEEHKRFLISFLFGGELYPGPTSCVARAYRDFSRTAHAITKGSNGGLGVRRRAGNGNAELVGSAQRRPGQSRSAPARADARGLGVARAGGRARAGAREERRDRGVFRGGELAGDGGRVLCAAENTVDRPFPAAGNPTPRDSNRMLGNAGVCWACSRPLWV